MVLRNRNASGSRGDSEVVWTSCSQDIASRDIHAGHFGCICFRTFLYRSATIDQYIFLHQTRWIDVEVCSLIRLTHSRLAIATWRNEQEMR